MPVLIFHSTSRPGKGLRRVPPPAAMGGAALLTALIFMVVLTMLGLSVTNSTSLEERIARNFRDHELAFAGAEAALRDAEIRITGFWTNPAQPVSPFSFKADCTNGLCDGQAATQPVYTAYSMTGSPSVSLGTTTQSPAISGLVNPPRYLIEIVCAAPLFGEGISATGGSPCRYLYRISAQSGGRLGEAQVLLQEVYVLN